MRIAFYAPLKPLDHPTPSGDRLMGRLLVRALERGGHEVEIAAKLRSRDARGDPTRQYRLQTIGGRLAERYVRRCERAGRAPDLWFTYHLYYKAPDWIGPVVAERLGIPYVVAEASHAPKRAGGPWDPSHRAVETALRQAARIITINSRDDACVRRLVGDGERLVHLPPFIEPVHESLPVRADRRPVELLTVAMMRPGDKLASYQVLAASLSRVADLPWRLTIIGDGRARAEVEHLLPPGERIRYLGRCGEEALARQYVQADLFVWPAVNEAFGMVFLEAQAAGLPVVAGAAGGVPDIVADGETGLLSPERDATGFAENLARLITDGGLRRRMGRAAFAKVRDEHHLDSAAARLTDWLREVA